jgi:hypothetical protein
VFAFFGKLTEYVFGIHRMALATVAKHRIYHIVVTKGAVTKSILRARFEGHCHHARLGRRALFPAHAMPPPARPTLVLAV